MRATSDQAGNEWRIHPALGPSLVVAGVSLLALVAAFANALPLIVQVFIVLLTCGAGSRGLLRLLRPGTRGLGVDGQRISVRDRSGSRLAGELTGSPFVSPVYVGIRWRPDGARVPRALGIFRGQMQAADFRRLCAALRQGSDW